MAKRTSSTLLDNIKTIIYAALIAVVIRTVAFEPFNIPSSSMVPTLLIGDYLFVSKYSYGYSRFSLPFAPNIFSGRVLFHMPHRGDVAVFKTPADNSTDFIKRIIGLPGDTVQVRQGRLYINGVEAPRTALGDYKDEEDDMTVMARLYREALPNGPVHDLLKRTDAAQPGADPDPNNTIEYKVPPGHFFAMGDNRDNSADSRFPVPIGVGMVPMENLVGRAEFLFFSVHGVYPWWQFWQWPFEIRWNRIFRGIT